MQEMIENIKKKWLVGLVIVLMIISAVVCGLYVSGMMHGYIEESVANTRSLKQLLCLGFIFWAVAVVVMLKELKKG